LFIIIIIIIITHEFHRDASLETKLQGLCVKFQELGTGRVIDLLLLLNCISGTT